MGRWPHLPIFHTGLGIWTQVSTLHGKCFFHWAISPFPVGFKKLLLRKEHPPSTHILSVLADMLKENKSVDFGMFSMYLVCDWALSFKSFLIIPLGFLDLSFCLKATWFPHVLRNYCFFSSLCSEMRGMRIPEQCGQQMSFLPSFPAPSETATSVVLSMKWSMALSLKFCCFF